MGGFYNGSSGIVEQIQAYTLPAAPTVATLAASSFTATGATLNGTVNANGSSTAVSFDYGTSNSYGTNVAGTPSPVSGGSAVAVTVVLTGLTPGATYHFRVNGVNAGGTANGNDLTFTALFPIESWRQTWYGSPANSGAGADNAAPNGDGIKNLLKYGLLIDPATPGAALLPKGERRTYAEGTRLAIIFNRDPARNDLSIFVEVADSVDGLTAAPTVLASSINGAAMSGPGLVGETDIGGGKKSVEVRDLGNIGAAPRRFLHIRVTR